jgi:glyoxylase-like metal-dependent hydrolase (beta-lactamase superfamily II)
VPISRRDFLKSSGGAALLASGAVWAPQAAHAQLDLGDMRLDVLSDGSLRLPGSFIFDPMPQDELAPVLEAYGQSPDLLTPPCNVTLLRHGGRNILFDVGSGPDFAPTAGLLLDSLDALGLAPEDITDVVFTHGHPDHLWGLLDDFDDPLFTEASYLIGKTEWDYWIDPNTVNRISSDRVPFAVGAKRRLEAIEDNIEFFKDGEEILPGVAARASFGHTPGHMAFEIRSGAQAAMVVGDAIGNDHVALARPNWISGSDQDGEAGAATRVSLLDQIATEQMPMIGFHITQGGIGRVEKATEGYHFIAET